MFVEKLGGGFFMRNKSKILLLSLLCGLFFSLSSCSLSSLTSNNECHDQSVEVSEDTRVIEPTISKCTWSGYSYTKSGGGIGGY